MKKLSNEQREVDVISQTLEKMKKEERETSPKSSLLPTEINNDEEPQKNRIVSLFTGAGGLDLGVQLATIQSLEGAAAAENSFLSRADFLKNREATNFETIYTNDNFKEANRTYLNNLIEEGTTQDSTDIRKVLSFPKSELLIGGFPCPGYSLGGPRLIDDKRNFLYLHFVRALSQSQPKFFIAENVKGLLTLGKGEVLKQIIEDFESVGYNVSYHLVNAAEYGVPQLRERVFIVGVNKNIVAPEYIYEFPLPTHNIGNSNDRRLSTVTLKDAIKDLESSPGFYSEGSYSSMYMSRNRKKGWDEPSFTIQASSRQAPQHPGGEPMRKLNKNAWEFQGRENRRLSLLEVARIQTFPDWYIFNGGDAETSDENRANKIYKQIGNAVPPLLAKAVCQPITDYLTKL